MSNELYGHSSALLSFLFSSVLYSEGSEDWQNKRRPQNYSGHERVDYTATFDFSISVLRPIILRSDTRGTTLHFD
jgi:hypothetical protein